MEKQNNDNEKIEELKLNNEEIIEELILEIPRLKSDVLERIENSEKTKVFNYKLFLNELKNENEQINQNKEQYKRKVFRYLVPVSIFIILLKK